MIIAEQPNIAIFYLTEAEACSCGIDMQSSCIDQEIVAQTICQFVPTLFSDGSFEYAVTRVNAQDIQTIQCILEAYSENFHDFTIDVNVHTVKIGAKASGFEQTWINGSCHVRVIPPTTQRQPERLEDNSSEEDQNCICLQFEHAGELVDFLEVSDACVKLYSYAGKWYLQINKDEQRGDVSLNKLMVMAIEYYGSIIPEYAMRIVVEHGKQIPFVS